MMGIRRLWWLWLLWWFWWLWWLWWFWWSPRLSLARGAWPLLCEGGIERLMTELGKRFNCCHNFHYEEICSAGELARISLLWHWPMITMTVATKLTTTRIMLRTTWGNMSCRAGGQLFVLLHQDHLLLDNAGTERSQSRGGHADQR